MRFGELLSRVGLECPEELAHREAAGVVTDSRRVIENCIFVCIRGISCDGHDHIEEAIEAGAAVIVAEKMRGVCVGGAAILYVENTRHTASLLYNVWYGDPSSRLRIIGVTGTNGKTSVALMTLAILESAGYPCGFLGTVGYRSVDGVSLGEADMTTPDPQRLYCALARMVADGAEYAVMEVSSHALAQCRTDAIEFDTAVFTNLTEDHLDFHGDMENYYLAKRKLFSQSRRAVVNIDDASGRRLFRSLEQRRADKKSCSLDTGDFCALLPKSKGALGIEYALKTADGIHRVSLPLAGDFQIINSLEAIAVGLMHGIPLETVKRALASLGGIRGRMEHVRAHERQDFDVFIDYAHTPDALERLLKSVRGFADDRARITLVFGCGGEREREKRKLMGQIASRLADTVIVTSDNSRSERTEDIIGEILRGIDKEKQYTVIADRREAIRRAILEYVRRGDVLILAGKGHETYQIDGDGKRYLDEREIVREALCELYDRNIK